MRRHLTKVGSIAFLGVALATGCNSSTSTEEPGPSGVVRTDPQYLDPPLDEEFVQYLIDSSTSQPQTIARKDGDKIQWLSDTAESMADYAMSFVSEDSAKHIPYVWGGKQIEKATAWSTPPDTNKAGCTARIGLDCSGFVGLVLDHFGVRPDVAEVSVAGLVNGINWQAVKRRGYEVLYIANPKADVLLPGDILIMMDDKGTLCHTGIFYSQTAKFGTNTQAGFVNSTGHSSCWKNYANEASGKLTGVVLSPYGPKTQARTLFAIRILLSPYMRVTIDGTDYVNRSSSSAAPFVFDTATGEFNGYMYDDSTVIGRLVLLHFRATGVNGKGTFPIPERPYDSTDKALFYVVPDSGNINIDSLIFTAAAPPTWWEGEAPPATGGEVKIESFARDSLYGTVAGTFNLKANAYWSRAEDSTYFQDTVKITTTVTKYYSRQQEVKGKFEGIMVLE